MAKITAGTELSVEPATGDVFPIVDVSEVLDANKRKKIAWSTIKTALYTPLDGRLSAAEGDIDSLESDIGVAQSDITTIEGDISDINSAIDAIDTPVFVNNGNGNPNVSDTSLAIHSIADSSWKSVGYTDAECDATWTALNGIPTDVDWIDVRITNTNSRDSTAANIIINIYATSFDSNETEGANNNIFKLAGRCNAGEYLSSIGGARIPVNARKFYIYRSNSNADTFTCI